MSALTQLSAATPRVTRRSCRSQRLCAVFHFLKRAGHGLGIAWQEGMKEMSKKFAEVGSEARGFM